MATLYITCRSADLLVYMKQILLDLYHNSNISLLLVRRAHHGVETFWSFTTYRPQARENHRGAFGIVKSQIFTVSFSTTLMKISSCFERAFQSRFPCFQKNTLVLTSLNFSRNLSFESALLGRYHSQLHCSCLSAGAVLEDPRRRISYWCRITRQTWCELWPTSEL